MAAGVGFAGRLAAGRSLPLRGRGSHARASGTAGLLRAGSGDRIVKSGHGASGEDLTIAPRYCISSSRGRGGAGERGPTAAGRARRAACKQAPAGGETPGSAPRQLEGALRRAHLCSRGPRRRYFSAPRRAPAPLARLVLFHSPGGG